MPLQTRYFAPIRQAAALLIATTFLSLPAHASCSDRLTLLSNQQLQVRLSSQFRNSFRKTWSGAWRHLLHGFNPLRPFLVIEQDQLLPHGELPKLASLDQVLVVRKSRSEGLRELQAAVNLPEERAWIFVPELNLWIYYSVRDASVRHVTINAVLRRALVAEWGRVEEYHTHPLPAVHEARRGHQDKKLYRRDGITFEDHAVFILCAPSKEDFEAILYEGDLDRGEPTSDHFIIHPWGLTYYSVHAPMVGYGPRDAFLLKPILPAPYYQDLLAISGDLDIQTKVEKMLELRRLRSQMLTELKYKELNLPAQYLPELVMEYRRPETN